MSENNPIIEWSDPPAPKPRRIDLLIETLKSKPNQWAKIDSGQISFLPWWGSISGRSDFETKIVYTGRDDLFGTRDVYARYIGGTDDN